MHLREASRCIENEHDDISLAILELARSIANLHSVEEKSINALQEIVDEIKRPSQKDS